MTAIVFACFLVFMLTVAAACVIRYLPRRTATAVVAGLAVWIVYVGLLSYFGVVRNPGMRPPGIVLIVLPVFLFVALFLVRTSAALNVALALPVWLILGLQSFRIGVELLLHQIWLDGLIPRLMTYEGGNVDIFVGLTAPLIAWMATKGRAGQSLALGWNVLGLLALANIMVRAALTAPGALGLVHAEVPNLAIGIFPFTFVAGFFAPLAVVLHVLSIRALRHASFGQNLAGASLEPRAGLSDQT
jgi:xanthine/uracil/vitamin C permease (AzgA family)